MKNVCTYQKHTIKEKHTMKEKHTIKEKHTMKEDDEYKKVEEKRLKQNCPAMYLKKQNLIHIFIFLQPLLTASPQASTLNSVV